MDDKERRGCTVASRVSNGKVDAWSTVEGKEEEW